MLFRGLDASEASAAHGLDGGLADLEVEVSDGGDDELVEQRLQDGVQLTDVLASHLGRD